jgi:hypothetical protein
MMDGFKESHNVFFTHIQEFLKTNQNRLEDALKRVGLVQQPDGSWSAPSGLPLVEIFIPMVIDAFSTSIYRFWNAVKHFEKGKVAFITANGDLVKAVGVLFYSKKNGFLMQLVVGKKGQVTISDFGGKVENKDKSLINSLERELLEESNEKLPHCDIRSLMIGFLYIPTSKYVLVICQAPQSFDDMDLSSFGTHEEHSRAERKVSWVSVPDFLKSRTLNPRLTTDVKNLVHSLF